MTTLARDSDTRYSVTVVDSEIRARARLMRLLKGTVEVDEFSSIEALEETVDLANPSIVVAGSSYANDAGFRELDVLSREHPDVAVVLVVDELSTDILQQALRSGVRDVLARPREPADLLEAIDRVAETLGGTPVRPGERQSEAGGRLTTVISTKGGVGKSVVSANLSVLLARSTSQPVALVDADLQFGDIAVMLNLEPRHTIVDVMSVLRGLDADSVRQRLVRHDASGLLVLPAPVEPAFADQVRAADLMRIINVLQSFCAHVVIDTAPRVDDIVLALLEESDEVLLVCALEIPSIKNSKLALQTLRLLNIPMSKIKLVLNRSPSKARLDVREVEQALQMKVAVEVPSHAAVARSVNEGVPVALSAPKSPAAKNLQKLAQLVMSDGAAHT